MRKLTVILFLSMFILYGIAMSQPHTEDFNIEEEDGIPSVYPFRLKVTNGTLTDNADGTVSLRIGPGVVNFVTSTDDYAEYILRDGTRDFTGSQSHGDFNITNVGDISLDSISSDGNSIVIGQGNTNTITLTDDTSIAIVLGSDAGDDFTVATTTPAFNILHIEGDTGRMGVGTSTPSAIFEIYGGDNMGTTPGFIISGTDDQNFYRLEISGKTGAALATAYPLIHTGQDDSRIALMAGTSAEWGPRIAFVGKGDTGNPGAIGFALIDYGADGTTINTAEFRLRWLKGTSDTVTVDMMQAKADDYVRFLGATDSNLLYVDATNDKVGIGTNSPASKLHIVDGNLPTITFGVNGILETVGSFIVNLDSDNNLTTQSFTVSHNATGIGGTVLFKVTEESADRANFMDGSITNVEDIALDSISADATDISLLNDTWLGDNIKLGFGNTAATPDALIDYDSGNNDLEIDLTNGTDVGMNIATENDANLFNIGVSLGANNQDNIGIGGIAAAGSKFLVGVSGNYTDAFKLVNTTNIALDSINNNASRFDQIVTLDNTGDVGLGMYRAQDLHNFFEGSGSGMDLNILRGQIHIKSITGATTFDTAIGTTMSLILNSAQTNTITTYDGYLSEAGSVAGGGSIDGTDWNHFRATNFPDYGGTITNTTGLWIDKQTRGGTFNAGIVLDGDGVGADLVLGDGQDAKIYYDGTNLIIDPDAVGTGKVLIGVTGDDDLVFNHATSTSFAIDGGVLTLKETTTPTAVTDYGKIYTKDNNELFFQDGDGAEHLLHGDAFSNIWYHGTSTPVTIGTQDEFIKINIIENVGKEDDKGNVTGNATNNEITVGANSSGIYNISFHTSITSVGANREMIIAPGIIFASPRVITLVTDDTVSPIVVTIVGHQFLNGDMVEISGVGGNSAANGSFMVISRTSDTFGLKRLDAAATTGNGNYTSGGTVDICYPGNMVMHRSVSQTNVGVGGGEADQALSDGDKVAIYVANLEAASNINFFMISLEIEKIGD